MLAYGSCVDLDGYVRRSLTGERNREREVLGRIPCMGLVAMCRSRDSSQSGNTLKHNNDLQPG